MMSISKITDAEFDARSISSLSVRPNAPSVYSGVALSSAELRSAFDSLSSLLRDRYNALVDEICASPEAESVASYIKTGISEGHTLAELFSDIKGGEAASYFKIGELSLLEYAARNDEDLAAAFNDVSFDALNGVFRFSSKNGSEKSISVSDSIGNAVDDAIASAVDSAGTEIDGLISEKIYGITNSRAFVYPEDEYSMSACYCIKNMEEAELKGCMIVDITYPEVIEPGFVCIVHFDSLSEGMMSYLPANANVKNAETGNVFSRNVLFAGDDVTDGIFSILPNNRYTLTFIHDGAYLNCDIIKRSI